MSEQSGGIPPDTKDWSSVVAEGCDQCGFRSQAPEAISGWLMAAVPLWVERLRAPDARLRPSDQVWSPTEYAAHVRDLSRLFLDRVAAVLSLDEPVLASWDQNEAAVQGAYERSDPQVVSEECATTLTAMASALAVVSEADWERRARRGDGWVLTVGDLANYFLHDIVHHLGDVGITFVPPGDDAATPPAPSR
jgi:hypothetical protein